MKPLQYEDLENIAVKENGEAMICLDGIHPNLLCQPINRDMEPHTGARTYVRSGAAKRLCAIAERLRAEAPDTLLLVVYGYRHPALQQSYFESAKAKLLAQNPALNAAALRRETHQYIASPDVAGHPTGGAVDVTLCRSGTELPMGGAIWDIRDTERIPTFSEKVTADERSNRLYLRTLMLSADFAPFDGEWWHFSYGDREWAAYYQKEFALYEMVGCTGAPPSFVHLLRFLS